MQTHTLTHRLCYSNINIQFLQILNIVEDKNKTEKIEKNEVEKRNQIIKPVCRPHTHNARRRLAFYLLLYHFLFTFFALLQFNGRFMFMLSSLRKTHI